jgi:ferredoxin
MSDETYLNIFKAIDEGPQMAPKTDGKPSKTFLEFLKLLYSEKEAEIVQHIKIGTKNFKTTAVLAELTGQSENEVKETLAGVCKNGRLVDFMGNYMLPPIPSILNNHMFYEETKPDDLQAAELYQTFYIKDGYYKYYESSAMGTQIMRVVSVDRTLHPEQTILDSENAHKIIEAANKIQLVPCPCRTRTEKMEVRECKDTPVGCCIMLNTAASFFENAGLGKNANKEETIKYFDQMQDYGLVPISENFNDMNHTIICLCCDCCCSQVRGRTRWENPESIAPSNFVAEATHDCIMCGECVDKCFFEAITLNDEQEKAVVDADKCMGCGVCAVACDQESIKLKRVERETPLKNVGHLMKTVAVENRGGQ